MNSPCPTLCVDLHLSAPKSLSVLWASGVLIHLACYCHLSFLPPTQTILPTWVQWPLQVPSLRSEQKTGAPLSIFILIDLPDHLCRGVQVRFLTAVLAFWLFKCQQLGSTEWNPLTLKGHQGSSWSPIFYRSCIKAFASTPSTSASFILFLNSHQKFWLYWDECLDSSLCLSPLSY